jgi:hypothetical protein
VFDKSSLRMITPSTRMEGMITIKRE